jgi:DNA-binding transcriptional MerR regulator
MKGYRTRDVVRMTGISYRRLDYWDREGLLVPSLKRADGSGSARIYSDEDVARASCIARLQTAGVSLTAIKLRTPEGALLDLQAMFEEMGVQ